MNKHTIRILTIGLALLLVIASIGLAQDDGGDADDAPPAPVTDAAPDVAPPAPMLLNLNLEWVNSDICRLIEELRRTRDPWQKREMVEQIEYMIYKHVEHPLMFKQAERSARLDLDRIGTSSDIVDAGSAHPLAPLVGEAFALYAVAKGYEGFAAAANDWIKRAKAVYPTVEAVTVKIDTYQDRRPIRFWLTESLGNWARTDTVRVTIEGKNISQASVAKVMEQKVRFASQKGTASDYYLAVAQADFLRGLKRYIVTTEKLTEQRPNRFEIYLPPGKYTMDTGSSGALPIEFKIVSDPSENRFVVETLSDSVTLYAKPEVGEAKKSGGEKPKDK
ncbi:MAG: hypothetical protein P9L99_07165 [Candidatus Lernaella stagnicola]|nr:hypothetical protein [Candidatus Lernaella stagnicola]